jgi:hypothetical protein
VESVTQVEVVEREDRDVMILINGNLYKFDVSDYTGKEDRYIFYNPSNGRIVIEAGDVQKVFKLDVDLIDK